MEALNKFFGGMILLVISTLLGLFTVSVLWGWFITPAFGIVAPTYPQLGGMGIIISLYVIHHDSGDSDEFLGKLLVRMFQYLFALLFGWVFTLFM